MGSPEVGNQLQRAVGSDRQHIVNQVEVRASRALLLFLWFAGSGDEVRVEVDGRLAKNLQQRTANDQLQMVEIAVVGLIAGHGRNHEEGHVAQGKQADGERVGYGAGWNR